MVSDIFKLLKHFLSYKSSPNNNRITILRKGDNVILEPATLAEIFIHTFLLQLRINTNTIVCVRESFVDAMDKQPPLSRILLIKNNMISGRLFD